MARRISSRNLRQDSRDEVIKVFTLPHFQIWLIENPINWNLDLVLTIWVLSGCNFSPMHFNHSPKNVWACSMTLYTQVTEREEPYDGKLSCTVTTSHLSYTFNQGCHCKAIVKVHGVLPSSRWYFASSQRIQFHWVYVGDSRVVVTPFV